MTAYLAPFAVFCAFLVLQSLGIAVSPVFRFLVCMAVIGIVSTRVISPRLSRPAFSVLVGVAVFAIWIGPDALIPGYRNLPLFHNAIVGSVKSGTPPADRASIIFLVFRVLISVIAVPVLEELFWRGFLLRWLTNNNFRSVPMGTCSTSAFWIVAVLFASEHGPFWDVGLAAGILYNWWWRRTRNLTDCILAHAATNACLAAYVIGRGQWQYWL